MASDPPSSPEPRRWLNAAVVGQEASRETWALAAREKLEATAATYGATVSLRELADFVQERSLIRTKQLSMSWIGDVLGRVARECVDRREPLLSSLCVDAKGHVSPAYAVSVEVLRGEKVADPDDHAAQERWECHRWFGAELPADGGGPVVTVRVATPRPAREPRVPGTRARSAGGPIGAGASGSARSGSGAGSSASGARTPRATKPAAEEKPLAICPIHFTVLPATGICDDCA